MVLLALTKDMISQNFMCIINVCMKQFYSELAIITYITPSLIEDHKRIVLWSMTNPSPGPIIGLGTSIDSDPAPYFYLTTSPGFKLNLRPASTIDAILK
ncbi:hypothetical protein VNO77_28009 [Canavalia gladiata]|uniref:Uncharacterized protein n=1 Tax=Canavalia gladiata TaxID=3824 RepID=A0AAN9KV24_CANGL